MSVYSITYYLKEDNHSCGCEGEEHDHHHHHRDDYDITATIKSLGSWAHCMPTSFIVKTNLNSNEILEKLNKFTEENDILFVTKVDITDVATTLSEAVDWIQS